MIGILNKMQISNEPIDTLLCLGLELESGLGLEFSYVRKGDVCTYPHYLQATSIL